MRKGRDVIKLMVARAGAKASAIRQEQITEQGKASAARQRQMPDQIKRENRILKLMQRGLSRNLASIAAAMRLPKK